MDNIVIIAAVVAIIAILGVTLMLNPSDSGTTTKPTDEGNNIDDSQPTSNPTDDDDRPRVTAEDNVDYKDATYGMILEEVEGNCKLYKHVVTDKYACFGTAGNYSTLATNEYRKVDEGDYFCKPTKFGCRAYQKVDFILP
jgi:hypothetical protein